MYAPWLILVIIVGAVIWAVISSRGNSSHSKKDYTINDNSINSWRQNNEVSPTIDYSNQSDFQRQLQENIKTPQQVENGNWLKEKEQIIEEANRDYKSIKSKLLEKAKSGQYSITGNQKYICIDFYCNYLLKCIDRQYYYRPTEKACYNINKMKQYNLYLNTITKLSADDNINIVPFFAEVNILKNNENRISLPYTYTHKYGQSVATHKIKVYLKYSIQY